MKLVEPVKIQPVSLSVKTSTTDSLKILRFVAVTLSLAQQGGRQQSENVLLT